MMVLRRSRDGAGMRALLDIAYKGALRRGVYSIWQDSCHDLVQREGPRLVSALED